MKVSSEIRNNAVIFFSAELELFKFRFLVWNQISINFSDSYLFKNISEKED